MAKKNILSFPLVFLVIVLSCLLVYINMQGAEKSEKGRKRVVAVKAVEVAKSEFRDVVEALGNATANEEVEISSKQSEFVKSVNFDDNQIVEEGFVLVEQVDIEEKSKIKELQANLDESKAQYRRFKELLSLSAASQAQVDEQEAKVKGIQAQLESAYSQLDDLSIKAPFNGVLGMRNVSKGAYINSGDVITTLDDISQIKVDFTIPERYLPTIEVGQRIEASTKAYENETFIGQVFSIDSRIDQLTRTVRVRAIIKNPDYRLRPGMLMSIVIERHVDNIIILPESAIIPIEENQYVYLVDGDKAKRIPVTTGRRKLGIVEIVDGLELGQKVVVEGALKLNDGSPIRLLGDK